MWFAVLSSRNPENLAGLRRYLYEWSFHQSVASADTPPLTLSQVRAVRSDFDQSLRARYNLTMDSPELSPEQFMVVANAAMQYMGRPAPYDEDSVRWRDELNRFNAMVGLDGLDDGATPRIPISPYDPRYSGLRSIRNAGSDLRYIQMNDLDQRAGGRVSNLHEAILRSKDRDFTFKELDNEGGLNDAGSVATLDDYAGLTEMAPFMSAREYAMIRQDVINARLSAYRSGGVTDQMYRDGLSRSVAIMRDLQNEGISYSVKPDRNSGQVKLSVDGTGLEVRLIDVDNPEFSGARTYDNGVVTTINIERFYPMNRDAEPNITQNAYSAQSYRMSPTEAVDMVRLNLGLRPHHVTVEREGTTRTGYKEYNNQYRADAKMSVKWSDYYENGQVAGRVLLRRDFSNKSESSMAFEHPYDADADAGGRESAKAFLNNAVTSARNRFVERMGTERMIAEFMQNREAVLSGDYEFEFDADSSISAFQRTQWDTLVSMTRGEPSLLLRPEFDTSEYRLALDAPSLSDEERRAMLLESAYMHPDPIEVVREYAQDVTTQTIGQFGPDEVVDGRLVTRHPFNAIGVAAYMDSNWGMWRNGDNIVSALRALGSDGSDLVGDTYRHKAVINRLIYADAQSQVDMASVDDPYIQRMNDVIDTSLRDNGVSPLSIKIDDQGIVEWEGTRKDGRDVNSKEAIIKGYLGQIIAPGEYGEITTKFAAGDNYMFVPGYEARVVAQKPGEFKTMEERTRLKGMEQSFSDAIRHRITSDVTTKRQLVGEPASLNNVYRHLTDTRRSVDFMTASAEEGLSEEYRRAILATDGRRVRYPNSLRDDSGMHAESSHEDMDMASGVLNDNNNDPFILTGGRSMPIMSEEGDPYYDKIATSSAGNQGVVRYLLEGTEVDGDGRMIASPIEGDRTPAFKLDIFRHSDHDPFDRQQMAFSNFMQAVAVTEPSKTAMMSFGAYEMEDGMVVSSRFAQRYQVRGVDGEMRPLRVGDKISELHGNKGVIGLVVDPDREGEMIGRAKETYEYWQRLVAEGAPESDQISAELDHLKADSLSNAHTMFAVNPDLDVVMSPFSLVSRKNAGGAHEIMENPSDLVVNGETKAKHAGDCTFIVTPMTVDSKTNVYDDEAFAEGRGRNASSQLFWSLQSKGAVKTIEHITKNNVVPFDKLREICPVMGSGMSASAQMTARYVGDPDRYVFPEPELKYKQTTRRKVPVDVLDTRAMQEEFGRQISERGGDMLLPFSLKTPAMRMITRDKLDPDQVEKFDAVMDELPVYGVSPEGHKQYRLPVLSASMRSGQQVVEGVSVAHDYNNHYTRIFLAAAQYRDEMKNPPSAERAKKLRKYQNDAQNSYDAITYDLDERVLSGKENIFKGGVMSVRLPDSSTAVWSADPTLDLDTVRVSPEMAVGMNLPDGGEVVVWRDPQLRDAGLRYYNFVVDESLKGFSAHPVTSKSFDGDYDGDSLAVVNFDDPEVCAELREKFGMHANMLDKGTRDKDGTYPLHMHTSMTVALAIHEDEKKLDDPGTADEYKGLKDELRQIHADLNDVEKMYDEGQISDEVRVEAGREQLDKLNLFYHRALHDMYGHALSFASPQEHIDSIREICVTSGAKGSEGKLKQMAEYYGYEILDDEQRTVVDHGAPLVTRQDWLDSQRAQAIKTAGTGTAGSFSQRGIYGLRDKCVTAVLELTYPATQSVLQAKHDAVEANRKYHMLRGPLRDFWRGHAMEQVTLDDGATEWRKLTDDKGRPYQDDPERWAEQFEKFCADETGGMNVRVNPDHIHTVKDALTGEDGLMISIEDTETLNASPLDHLTYSKQGFAKVAELSLSGTVNLYDGEHNAHLMPAAVRRHREAELAQRSPEQVEHDARVDEFYSMMDPSRSSIPMVVNPVVEQVPPLQTDPEHRSPYVEFPEETERAPRPLRPMGRKDTRADAELRGAQRRAGSFVRGPEREPYQLHASQAPQAPQQPYPGIPDQYQVPAQAPDLSRAMAQPSVDAPELLGFRAPQRPYAPEDDYWVDPSMPEPYQGDGPVWVDPAQREQPTVPDLQVHRPVPPQVPTPRQDAGPDFGF